jgi:hypothetical protein
VRSTGRDVLSVRLCCLTRAVDPLRLSGRSKRRETGKSSSRGRWRAEEHGICGTCRTCIETWQPAPVDEVQAQSTVQGPPAT